MGDTWGISGPAFLFGYVVLAAIALLAAIRGRRAIIRAGGDEPLPGIGRHPHDVAYLNGGAELAVVSALTALRLRGAIWSERGNVQAVPRADRGADALERGLYAAAEMPTNRRLIASHRWVADVLTATEQRLVDAGLLLSPTQRHRIRACGWWMAGVGGLGVLRLLGGIANGKAVGFLAALLILTAVITMGLMGTVPLRTRRGDRTLVALRAEHHNLAPRQRPDWALYGAGGAALGIGLYGMTALWASDPAIAGELAVQRTSADAGGGGGGSCSGGDSGGSSCGGGGGCGGGCGG